MTWRFRSRGLNAVMSTASGAESALPSLTTRVTVVIPGGKGAVGVALVGSSNVTLGADQTKVNGSFCRSVEAEPSRETTAP